jgi:acyl carrier protein
MESFRLDNLIDLLKDAGEQDESALASFGVNDADSSFDDLGVDSLTLLTVVAQLEVKYSISIGMTAATATKTPHELFLLVQAHLADNRQVA